jgi:hypothetical protein
MRDSRNDLDRQSSKLAFSISEVVRTSGIGRTLVFAEIKVGRLIARKCGRRTLILKEDLLKWLSTLPAVETEASLGPITKRAGQ